QAPGRPGQTRNRACTCARAVPGHPRHRTAPVWHGGCIDPDAPCAAALGLVPTSPDNCPPLLRWAAPDHVPALRRPRTAPPPGRPPVTDLRTGRPTLAWAGARASWRRLGAAALVAALPLLGSGLAGAGSLRFLGTGAGDIDRVKIPLDGPPRPVDVGATDFTLEWWMKALPGDNAVGQATCDAADGWITGHVLLDRDVFGDGDHGDFGVSVTGGRLAFGVSAGAAGTTICGGTDVADGAWHHVAVTRRRADGRLRIYVDGVLDAAGAGGVGPDRDVSYRDGRPTAYPDSDPFLVLGAEKHDAGPGFP